MKRLLTKCRAALRQAFRFDLYNAAALETLPPRRTIFA